MAAALPRVQLPGSRVSTRRPTNPSPPEEGLHPGSSSAGRTGEPRTASAPGAHPEASAGQQAGMPPRRPPVLAPPAPQRRRQASGSTRPSEVAVPLLGLEHAGTETWGLHKQQVPGPGKPPAEHAGLSHATGAQAPQPSRFCSPTNRSRPGGRQQPQAGFSAAWG